MLYRLAGDDVAACVSSLRELTKARVADVDRVVRDYFAARDALDPLDREELLARVERGKAVVLDVRPFEEFAAGHIPGALSVPLDQLEAALSRLPKRAEIVAYCRGPYCVLAPQAVQQLRAAGFTARRLADGLPEWRLAGLPVALGQE